MPRKESIIEREGWLTRVRKERAVSNALKESGSFGRCERSDPILPGHYVLSIAGDRSTVQSLLERSIEKSQKIHDVSL
jgi:hypothetical protein